MLIKPFPRLNNIHAIAIPIPDISQLITANVFVVGKGPVTLIDTGPKSPTALDFIESQLSLKGLGFQDIERIILTHGHVDHFGLATAIKNAAGRKIQCFIHAEDRWQLSSQYLTRETATEEWADLMANAGLPQGEMEIIRKQISVLKGFGDALEDVSIMVDGQEFNGDGYELKVVHTPGHTPGSCCIYECRQQVLFSGDHLIKHITPNLFIGVKKERLRNGGYRSLTAFIDSLDKLLEFDARFVCSGHGEYIEDLPGIISSYKTHHHQRSRQVRKALYKKERTLYAIIDEVFSHVPQGETFLAISELAAHLEILLAEGKVALVDPGPPALYKAL